MYTECLLRIYQSLGIQPLRPTGCAGAERGDHRWSDRWVTDKYRILETQSNNSWRGLRNRKFGSLLHHSTFQTIFFKKGLLAEVSPTLGRR
ncbi:hypothetical protein CDAR_550361 [Caerostris darwini]|uniref:Uncharacterized protein n=1 Tax=Caerostris darwini TaxID=1538125 RepID=A0AAV4X984_9ARAC|nr:hypothetical protein CDAR_550361 [Caerostris darwini]